MLGFLTKSQKKKAQATLPPELVVAIENTSCTFRSFHQNETGDKIPRPLCMNFLGSRPMYLDDDDVVSRWIAKRYPELSQEGVQRALRLLRARIVAMHQEARRDAAMMTGRPRRNGWMSFIEDL